MLGDKICILIMSHSENLQIKMKLHNGAKKIMIAGCHNYKIKIIKI